MRKDIAEELIRTTLNVGYGLVTPEVKISGEVAMGVLKTCLEHGESSGSTEEFGINSGGTSTLTNSFKLRTSMAIPKTKTGDLICNLYPTSKTADRVKFYNKILEHYNKKPISLREALDHPEATNDKLDELNSELKKNPYKYNDDWLDSVDEINDAF